MKKRIPVKIYSTVTKYTSLENVGWLDEAMLDLVIFKSKYAEAVRAGLVTEHEVWQKWLV